MASELNPMKCWQVSAGDLRCGVSLVTGYPKTRNIGDGTRLVVLTSANYWKMVRLLQQRGAKKKGAKR